MTGMRSVVLLLLPAIAHADDRPHVNAGLEIGVGADSTLLAGRVHGGASHAFGTGRIRPSIAVGATLGVGRVERMRTMRSRYVDYGPEVQLGVEVAGNGLLANRAFASVAYVDGGWRLGLGANIAELAGRAAREPGRGVLLVVMPQQIEITWSAHRVGVTFSYGI